MIHYLLLLLCTISVQSFVILTPNNKLQCAVSPRSRITQVQLVPEIGAAVVCAGAALVWFSGSEERARKAKYAEWEQVNQVRVEEMKRLAHIEPRDEPWKEHELKAFDGTQDPDGPILVAAAGKVYNVWKGRHFYGPGGEYSIFAGRDATRLLGKFRTEEEDEESLKKPLTMAERATLEGYLWTFKDKYDVVGTLEGFDPKDTAMW
jgi:predicted heme/steroid binding protein